MLRCPIRDRQRRSCDANQTPPTLTAQAPASVGQAEAPKLLPSTDPVLGTTLQSAAGNAAAGSTRTIANGKWRSNDGADGSVAKTGRRPTPNLRRGATADDCIDLVAERRWQDAGDDAAFRVGGRGAGRGSGTGAGQSGGLASRLSEMRRINVSQRRFSPTISCRIVVP